MRASTILLLMATGCAWVTEDELARAQEPCDCPDGGLIYYPDDDGDGFGDLNGATTCPEGEGWITTGDDCDDHDNTIFPGADETCNGADDDCDEEVDEDDAVDAWRWFQDADGDGFGDPEVWTMACAQPSGWVNVTDATDCDDGDRDVNPDADEICNDGLDNDCDGGPGDCQLSGPQPWTYAGLTIQGSAEEDGTGRAMAGGSDLAGSGHADIAIGVQHWSGRASDGGAVLIFDGPGDAGPVGLDAAVVKLEGYEEDLGAGRSVAMLGDLDGGGEPWLAVGCLRTDGSVQGRLALIEGPFTMSSIDLLANADVIIEGDTPGDSFAHAVSGGLDATGDGFPDLAVAAPGFDSGHGRVWFFEGPVSAFATLDSATGVVSGESDSDLLGTSVALVPDIDGDGLAELLTGAYIGGDSNEGEVLLFLSPLDSAFEREDADERYLGEAMNDTLSAVSSAGDVDGDGHNDLLMGAPWRGDANEGAVYLVLGATNPASTLSGAYATIEGSVAGGGLGHGVAGLGDFDGDGYDDILLGAPGTDDPGSDAGSALLFHGPLRGTIESASADAVIHGPEAGAAAGAWVAAPGDIDGDGRDDALLGAHDGLLGQVALLHGEGW